MVEIEEEEDEFRCPPAGTVIKDMELKKKLRTFVQLRNMENTFAYRNSGTING